MTDMLERVARAIYEVRPPMWAEEVPGQPEPVYTEMSWETAKARGISFEAIAQACAAIAAMREPTAEMMQAGCASNPPGQYHADTKLSEIIGAEWTAMIDQALSETSFP